MNKSDTDNSHNVTAQPAGKRQVILPVVIVALIAVSAVEGWYLYDTKKQLEGVQATVPQGVESKTDEVVAVVEPATTVVPKQQAVFQHNASQQNASQQNAPQQNASQQADTRQPAATVPPAIAPGSPPQTSNSRGVQPYGYRNPFDDPFFQNGLSGQDPYAEIQRMQQEMDAMMRDAFHRNHQYFGNNWPPAYAPAWNQPGGNVFNMQMSSGDLKVDDKGDNYVVTLAVKDADKNNLDVNIDDNRLTVSGQQVQNNRQTDENGNTVFEGQMNASFSRSITLPGPVKPDSMHTQIHDNVLEITIEKAS